MSYHYYYMAVAGEYSSGLLLTLKESKREAMRNASQYSRTLWAWVKVPLSVCARIFGQRMMCCEAFIQKVANHILRHKNNPDFSLWTYWLKQDLTVLTGVQDGRSFKPLVHGRLGWVPKD